MRMRVSCQYLAQLRMLTIIVSLVLSLAIVGTDGKGWGAEPEETIPDENDLLTLSELRWCSFEDVRLEGEGDEIDAYKEWEVDSYNARISQYNHRCSNKSYYERDKTRVERELTIEKRQTLEEQGALRATNARDEREKRRVYVNDEVARILAAPEDAAEELRRVPRWGELLKTGRVQGSWYEVEWQEPSLDNVLKFGWVLGGLLEGGSGREARFKYCEEHAGRRAQHNDIVRKEFGLVGSSQIEIYNGVNSDAYVKLIRSFDDKVVAVFIEKGRKAVVKGVSEGSYKVAFATGTKFSRGCRSFSVREAVQRFDRQIDFNSRTSGWELTLYSTSDGNARTSSMSYDDFDRL